MKSLKTMKRELRLAAGLSILMICIISTGCARKQPINLPELSALGNAARQQDLKRVRALLSGGAEVNAREKNGETALYDALECEVAKCNNVSMIDVLLDHGAQINSSMPWWGTPLSFSLTRDYGREAATLEIIKRGAYITKTFGSGDTELSIATQNHWLRTMEALLKGGADPNCGNAHVTSALYWAVLNGDDDSAKMLLEYGANARQSYAGKTLLSVGTYKGNDRLVEKRFAATRSLLIRYGAN